jgi:hypothetical protein
MTVSCFPTEICLCSSSLGLWCADAPTRTSAHPSGLLSPPGASRSGPPVSARTGIGPFVSASVTFEDHRLKTV